MKYAVVLVALFAGAFAMPQESSTITSAPAMPSASLTPQQSCLKTCKVGDVMCQATCLGVARPNESQAVDTNKCAAACDQGNGSAEDTKNYAKCQQDCFASLFPSSQTNFGAGAGAAVSSAASGGASATNSAGSVVASRTSALASGASGTATPSLSSGAASVNSVQLAGAGLAGLVAIFAL